LVVLGLLLLQTNLSYAQSYHGGLRGAVTDNNGKALVGATLTLVNEQTNVSRVTVANEAGEYVFERVDPGKYKITATLAGFKKTDRTGVVFETQRQVTLDLMLAVGEVTEIVVINGDALLIETSNPSTSTLLSKHTLDDLPNAWRNPFILSAITPNVIPANRFDPVGAKLVQYFPLPHNGQSRYVETSTLSDRADQQTLKFDHEVTKAYKVSAFYAHYGSREPEADYYKNIANPGGSLLFRNVHALAWNNIVTLGPATLLSLRYGYNTFDDNVATSSADFDVASLGFDKSFTNDIVFRFRTRRPRRGFS